MAIKEITVGVRHLVNIGDFENMTIEASVNQNIEDGDFNEARASVQDTLTILLADTFERQKNPEWFKEIPRKLAKLQAV